MIVQFVERLKERMQGELPGISAQQKMAPEGRQIDHLKETDYPQSRKASVLILFYPHKNDIYTVLMKRPDYEGVHSGQISFPGGSMEITDKDASFTALREAEEELGIKKEDVTLAGNLTPIYIPPSNFFVFPFIGYSYTRPDFVLQEKEVAGIVELPLKLIHDETIKGAEQITRNGISFKAPYYLIGQHKVWGATAIILSELEALLKDVL